MSLPRLFKPFSHDATKEIYSAATAEHLNPIYIADSERRIFKQELHFSEAPDLVVSLGTGVEQALLDHTSCTSSMVSEIAPACSCTTVGTQNLRKQPRRHRSFVACQTTSDAFVHDFPDSSTSQLRFIRFNPPAISKLPSSDDLDQLEGFKMTVRELVDRNEIKTLAAKLLATLFYYEPVGNLAQQADGTWMSTGMIRCRIPNDTRELSSLGKLMRRRKAARFVIRDENGKAQVLKIEDDVVTDMITLSRFSIPPIEIDVPQRSTVVDMMLVFENTDRNSISGFPRALSRTQTKVSRHRIALSSQRSEQASTRSSLRSRSTGQSWKPPTSVRKASPARSDEVAFSPLAAGVTASARVRRRDNAQDATKRPDRAGPSRSVEDLENHLARTPNIGSKTVVNGSRKQQRASSDLPQIAPKDVARSVKLMSMARTNALPMEMDFEADEGYDGDATNQARASIESLHLDLESRPSGESIQQLEDRIRELERIIRSKERIDEDNIRDSLRDEVLVGRTVKDRSSRI